MRRTSVWLLVLIQVALGCSGPGEKIPEELPMRKNSGKLVIYQLMTRLFGNQRTTNKPFGTIEENGVGKFADINDLALKKIKELGVTHVWFTGIIAHATTTDYSRFGLPADDPDVVKGRAGSPYSIRDYYDVSPDLAVDVPSRMKEFEQLVTRTHKQGLSVLIDFVPNHVARTYHSHAKPEGVKDLGADDDKTIAFSPKNNFYYLPGQSFQPPKETDSARSKPFAGRDGKFEEIPAKVTGNNQFTASPGINDWYESVKLNYGVDIQQNNKTYFDPVPDTWEKMRDILLFWTARKVDGFRCDMAEMVPVEFWHWVIPQVRAVNPDILFIAEIYQPALYHQYVDQGHFDFLYDKVQLYDTLRRLINQHGSTAGISKVETSLSGLNGHMIHFLENHDEQRIASRFFCGDSWKAVPGMVVSSLIDTGPIMIYFGQEVGEPASGVVGLEGDQGQTPRHDYAGVPEFQKWMNGGKFDGGQLSDEQKQLRQFYGDILSFAATNPAIGEGAYIDLTEENIGAKNISDRIYCFVRVAGDERLLIISGFNAKTEHARIQLTKAAVEKLNLRTDQVYIGHDLLRSSSDIGFDKNFTCELDVPPYSAFIFKLK